jgi:acyl-CoA thioester hydrolase
MEPFPSTFKVQEKDIDTLNHVNNVTYLKWVQEISVTHWFSITTPEINNKFYWVVLRHEIDYHHAVFLDEEITAVTWVGESEGVKSDRFVHFYCKDKLISRAKTTWCLMDKLSNRPTRINDEILTILEPYKM